MAPSEAKALDLVIERLHRKFADVPTDTIRGEVDRIHHRYDHSRIRGFVAILVEREVADVLERQRHPVGV
jgi:hypothetical protein